MKILKNLVIGLLVLIAILILVAGYFGLVPGVSTLFGADKPRDLGIVTSDTISNEAMSKVASVRDGNPASAEKITYQGSHPVNISLSSEEISSLYAKGTWKYNPIAGNFQVKIHSDGTVEASGMLDRARLDGYLASKGFSDLQSYTKTLAVLPAKVPFYVEGSLTVSNNKVAMNVTSAQVGRLPLPTDAASTQAAESVIERGIAKIPGFSVTSLDFKDGKMNFNGTFPSKMEF
jgi:hypothetical protein